MTRESDSTAVEPALFSRAPVLRGRIPWLPLGRFPSPVQRLDVPGFGPLLVKRDDGCADGYAGNKVRKLEFLLGAARAAGARRLITIGAAGSHHALATAWHGRAAGFRVSLVLFPQPITEHVRQVLLMDVGAGAELRWVRRMEAVPFGVWRARLAHRGDRPMVIPPGGSSETGTLGYVSAALELADQLRDGALERPSRIHVAGGTLGTAAGLAIGLAWAGIAMPVIATRITSRVVTNERVLEKLVRGTIAVLRGAGAEPPDAAAALRLVELRHDQIGPGYGRETEAARAAADLFAGLGLRLDATYTAKAAAGVLADGFAGVGVERAAAGAGPPLFWQTLSSVEPDQLLRTVTPDDLPLPVARYVRSAAAE